MTATEAQPGINGAEWWGLGANWQGWHRACSKPTYRCPMCVCVCVCVCQGHSGPSTRWIKGFLLPWLQWLANCPFQAPALTGSLDVTNWYILRIIISAAMNISLFKKHNEGNGLLVTCLTSDACNLSDGDHNWHHPPTHTHTHSHTHTHTHTLLNPQQRY